MFRLREPYALLFIILTVLSVYYPAIFAEVLSIDDQRMLEGLLNSEGFTFKGVFFPGGGYYYRPLLYASFIADKYLWFLHESFLHLENIVFHAINSCLVYLITARVARLHDEASSAPSLFAALVFALHPLATEPVNWLSGRTDLMAAMFLFTSFYVLLKHIHKQSLFLLIVSAILFFISPLAKETSLFWYPAAMIMIYSLTRDASKTFPRDLTSTFSASFQYYLAFTAATAGYFILRHFALKSYDSGIGLAVTGVVKGSGFELFNKARVTLKVFGFYFKKLIFPLPLNFIINTVSNWYLIVGVVAIIVCLWLLYRRNLLSSIALMGVAIMLPALLVPLGGMALAPVAERYLYMPVAFFAVAVSVKGASSIRKHHVNNRLVAGAFLILLFFFGFATWQRNLVWQTNLTFFQYCSRQNPESLPIKNELARALENAGRRSEAEQIYMSAKLPTTGNYKVVTEINKATTMASRQDVKGAIAYLKSVDCSGSHPYYKNYLQTRIYLNGLLLDQAVSDSIRKSTVIENITLMKQYQQVSGNPYDYYVLARFCLTHGYKKDAVEYFRLAYDKSPPNAFYKEPARKLAERLGKELELKNR